MKRKCPDCRKTEVTSKKDRVIKKEWTNSKELPFNTCFKCLKFYESVENERYSNTNFTFDSSSLKFDDNSA